MKAWQVPAGCTSLEQLELVERRDPSPGARQVLVRDHAFPDQRLPGVASRNERLPAERLVVDGHLAPPERRQAGSTQHAVDLALPVRQVRALAVRKEEDTDDELVIFREPSGAAAASTPAPDPQHPPEARAAAYVDALLAAFARGALLVA